MHAAPNPLGAPAGAALQAQAEAELKDPRNMGVEERVRCGDAPVVHIRPFFTTMHIWCI